MDQRVTKRFPTRKSPDESENPGALAGATGVKFEVSLTPEDYDIEAIEATGSATAILNGAAS